MSSIGISPNLIGDFWALIVNTIRLKNKPVIKAFITRGFLGFTKIGFKNNTIFRQYCQGYTGNLFYTLAKSKTIFYCQSCGYESAKWLGKCPSCNTWNTFAEE